MSEQCPLYPQKQTLELSRVMSALCQKQTLPGIACGYRVAVTTNCGASAK
jgi:hypothetical protein